MSAEKTRHRAYTAILLVVAIVPLASAAVLCLEELSTPWQRKLAYQVSESRITEHLGFLASSPRPVGSEHLENSSRYIEAAFRSYGLTNVHFEKFAVGIPTGRHVNGSPLYEIVETEHVIGEIRGRGDAIVIVAAHYDSRNTTGADDNASGVSAMLEVARVLSTLSQNLTATVRFIAFSAEELEAPPYGSRHYVEEHRGEPIALMMNLDSIGYRGSRNVYLFNSCSHVPAPPARYAEVAIEAARDLAFPLIFKGGWAWRSPSGDFAPFAEAHIPILFFFEDNPEVVDTPDDTLENVSPAFVKGVAQVVLYTIALIYAEGPRGEAMPVLEATTRLTEPHRAVLQGCGADSR